MFKTSGDGSAF